MAWNLWHLGFPDQAACTMEDNLRWIREVNHANTTGLVLCMGTMTNIWLRRPEQVENAARESLREPADQKSAAAYLDLLNGAPLADRVARFAAEDDARAAEDREQAARDARMRAASGRMTGPRAKDGNSSTGPRETAASCPSTLS